MQSQEENGCINMGTFVKSTKMENFQWVRTLGVGGFARVDLVVCQEGKAVALKTVKKNLLTDPEVIRQMTVETEVLGQSGVGSLFVVQYLGSWAIQSSLVLVMEACLGGDLWRLMQRRGGRFEDSCARFYSCCVIEGLQYLSDRGVLYRDLKPENLLLDGVTGYLKIADFGFSRLLGAEGVASTLVGTAEYLAPEMLRGEGYGHRANLWALGVLIYELLTGQPPFHGEDHNALVSKIGKGFRGYAFPPHIRPGAEEVIRMLCRLNPAQRPGLSMIIKFSWYHSFDWAALRLGSLPAPILPTGEDDSLELEEQSEDFVPNFNFNF